MFLLSPLGWLVGWSAINVPLSRIETELKSLEQSMGEELMVWIRGSGVDGIPAFPVFLMGRYRELL